MDNLSYMELRKDVETEFIKNRQRQEVIAINFEQQVNYPMAYLAYWTIIEDFVKSLVPLCQRINLKRDVMQWSLYLDENIKKKPKAIKEHSFKLSNKKAKGIPSEDVLLNVLDNAIVPNLFETLNTSKKYRKRRNRIAHFAEDVSQDVYMDFKRILLLSTEEIEEWLKMSEKSKLNMIAFNRCVEIQNSATTVAINK